MFKNSDKIASTYTKMNGCSQATTTTPKKRSWQELISTGFLIWNAFQLYERQAKKEQHKAQQLKKSKAILLSSSLLGGLVGIATAFYLLSTLQKSQKKSLDLFHWHPFASNGHCR